MFEELSEGEYASRTEREGGRKEGIHLGEEGNKKGRDEERKKGKVEGRTEGIEKD